MVVRYMSDTPGTACESELPKLVHVDDLIASIVYSRLTIIQS